MLETVTVDVSVKFWVVVLVEVETCGAEGLKVKPAREGVTV